MPLADKTRIRSLYRGLAGLLVAGLVAGCSSTENLEKPAPVPEVVASVSLKPDWTMSVGDGHDGKYLFLEPLILDNTVYAVSADRRLVAVRADSGEVLWRKRLGADIMAGVGGDSDRLYLVTENASLLALDRSSGDKVWEQQLTNEVLAPPQSNGSMVVAQTVDGSLIAAASASGQKLWQYDASVPALTIRGSGRPLVGSELVLTTFANGRLVALSADTGQPQWQYTVSEPSGRTELERLVDVTARPVILEDAALVAGYQGKLALVDLRNGEEIWSERASTFHSPALGEGRVFVASANGEVLGLDAGSLDQVWLQEALAWRQLSPPQTLDDYLLVGDFEGYIHILAQEDGELQGQYHYDDEGIRVAMQRWQDGVIVYGNAGKLGLLRLEKRN